MSPARNRLDNFCYVGMQDAYDLQLLPITSYISFGGWRTQCRVPLRGRARSLFIRLPCQSFAINYQTSDIFLRSCPLPLPSTLFEYLFFEYHFRIAMSLHQNKRKGQMIRWPQRQCFLQLTILLIKGQKTYSDFNEIVPSIK